MSDRADADPAGTRTDEVPLAEPGPVGDDGRPRVRARDVLGSVLPAPGPQRVLTGSVLAVTVGGGMLMGSSALYLTRVVGMSSVRVGLGLTVGAALGLVAGPMVGHLADRRGPREVHLVTLLFGAVATAGFVVVRAFWELVLVSLLQALVGAAGQASRAPLIRAVAGDRSTWFLSYQRAVTNVGIMAGISVATVGIQLDSGPVYVAVILASAATFVVGGVVLTRLPHVRPLEADAGRGRWMALTDRPYLLTTLINGGFSVHLAIPAFALPLWIANETAIPRTMITGVMLVNGLLVVGLQVRVSRGVIDPLSAGGRMRWAGLALLLSLGLIGATSGLSVWPAVIVLLVATVVYTFGELWHAAASFELAFGLAAPHAQGQYAGVFGLGQGAANAAAPGVLAATCLDHGPFGWLGLGAALMGLGMLTPYVVRWAQFSRPTAHGPRDPDGEHG